MGIWIKRFFGLLFLLLLIISSKAVFDAFELLTSKEARSTVAQKRALEPEVLLPTGSVNMVLDVAKPTVTHTVARDDLDMPPPQQVEGIEPSGQ